MFENFKELLHKKIKRIFLIVWPPEGEKSIADVDISIGIVLYEQRDRLYVITTDNDNWTPCLKIQDIPNIFFTGHEFSQRIKKWMNLDLNEITDWEYYDATLIPEFIEITNSTVEEITLLKTNNSSEPFGIKLTFPNDYILSSAIADGNTIETRLFNKNDNLKNFQNITLHSL